MFLASGFASDILSILKLWQADRTIWIHLSEIYDLSFRFVFFITAAGKENYQQFKTTVDVKIIPITS
jgi:hypothetical protein